MESYGSQLFANIKFRDGFVMIGQRGVAKGKAIEYVKIKKVQINQILILLSNFKIEPKGKKDFATEAKISGCANFPRI